MNQNKKGIFIENTINTKSKPIIAIIIASIPLITLFGIELYVSGFDGWGAWAAAPLLLLPAVLSIVIGITFMLDLIRAYRSDKSIQIQFICLIIALIPIIWLFVRRLFR